MSLADAVAVDGLADDDLPTVGRGLRRRAPEGGRLLRVLRGC